MLHSGSYEPNVDIINVAPSQTCGFYYEATIFIGKGICRTQITSIGFDAINYC